MVFRFPRQLLLQLRCGRRLHSTALSDIPSGFANQVCISRQKKPAVKAGSFNACTGHDLLFDLSFLVHDVLAHDGVVFFNFYFFRRVLLVFVGRVKVTGAGRGIQSDFISCALGHGSNPPLYLFAACPQVFQHNIDAFLVDDAHTLG
jgi:hypothetical protein